MGNTAGIAAAAASILCAGVHFQAAECPAAAPGALLQLGCKQTAPAMHSCKRCVWHADEARRDKGSPPRQSQLLLLSLRTHTSLPTTSGGPRLTQPRHTMPSATAAALTEPPPTRWCAPARTLPPTNNHSVRMPTTTSPGDPL